MEKYRYVNVLVDGVNRPYYYICDMEAAPGTPVLVPFGPGNAPRQGIVQTVGWYTAEDAPYPVEKTKRVIRVLTPDEYAAGRQEAAMTDQEIEDIEEADFFMESNSVEDAFYWAVDHQNDTDHPATIRKVVECYLWCMERGMPQAATNLGAMYYNGSGVPQDYRKAAQYYELAAKAGHHFRIPGHLPDLQIRQAFVCIYMHITGPFLDMCHGLCHAIYIGKIALFDPKRRVRIHKANNPVHTGGSL